MIPAQLQSQLDDLSRTGTTIVATALARNPSIQNFQQQLDDINQIGRTIAVDALARRTEIQNFQRHLDEISQMGATITAAALARNPSIQKLKWQLGDLSQMGTAIATDAVARKAVIQNFQQQLGAPNAMGGMAAAIRFSSIARAWAPAMKSSGSLVAAAVEFQVTNPAAASTLATVAGQRVAATGRANTVGSFDSQFSAVVRHLGPEHVPFQLQQQLSAEMDDPQTAQTVAATVGLSAVPASKFDRMLLALLLGFTAMMLYGFVQHGMVGGLVTPQLGAESIVAGAATFKAVRWADDARAKLQKK